MRQAGRMALLVTFLSNAIPLLFRGTGEELRISVIFIAASTFRRDFKEAARAKITSAAMAGADKPIYIFAYFVHKYKSGIAVVGFIIEEEMGADCR